MIVIVATHAATMPQTNPYLIGYVEQSELILFEGRTSFDVTELCNDEKDSVSLCNLSNKYFTIQDYRKVPSLEKDLIYVRSDISQNSLPYTTYGIFINDLDWYAISSRNDKQKFCKRCLSTSSQRCKTLIYNVHEIKDCRGKYYY